MGPTPTPTATPTKTPTPTSKSPTPTPKSPSPTTTPTTPAPTKGGGGTPTPTKGGGGKPAPPTQAKLRAQVKLKGMSMTRFASSTTKEGFKRAVLPGVLGGKLCGTTSSPRKCTVSDVAITNFRKRRAGGTDSVTVDFEITVAASQKEIAK